MEVISTPIPTGEPTGPTPLPTSPGRKIRLSGRMWAALAAALLIGIATGAAGAATMLPDPKPIPDLASTLDWMFTASLTHTASTEDGELIPPPADALRIQEVRILDPVKGPILAMVEVDHAGTHEIVGYEITVRRDGRAWTVTADPLGGVSRE